MTDRLQYWQRARLIFGAELGSREKLVLLAISDHLGSNDTAWPSVPRLMRRCGAGRNTVLRGLKELEDIGAIKVHRPAGGSNRYQIQIAWLQSNQSQYGTSADMEPVPDRDPPSPNMGLPPVSDWDHPSPNMGPKGDQEGNQKKEIKKEIKTARKTKASKNSKLTLPQVKAVPIPDGLPDGYLAAFERWVDVRSGDHWRKAASQTEAFHAKMLKAHQQRKDVMAALARAHELGWSGIKAGWMDDLPIQVSVDPDKPRRAMKSRAELLADYHRTLEIS